MSVCQVPSCGCHSLAAVGGPRLDGSQLAAVVHLLEIMVDPVAYSLANAPYEDEEITPELAAELDRACDSMDRGEGTSHEEVLRHYGLKPR
jgi:hypothetical protein